MEYLDMHFMSCAATISSTEIWFSSIFPFLLTDLGNFRRMMMMAFFMPGFFLFRHKFIAFS